MTLKINQATYGLYCSQPDQLIPLAIVDYFNTILGLTNKFVNIFGTNIYAYRRTDQGTISLPSLNVYVKNSHKTGDMGYLNGIVRCEICMPVLINRERITEAALTLYNNFSFIIMTNNFLNYICSIVPALYEFNWDTNNNFDNLYVDKNLTNYIIYMDLNYMVDLAGFYFYLNTNGLSVDDPCVQSTIVNTWDLTVDTNP